MRFTGRLSRREILTLSVAPLVGLLLPRRVAATEYATAASALDAMEGSARDVRERFGRLVSLAPRARGFVASLLSDHDRHASHRAEVRRRLGLAASPSRRTTAADTSLDALRSAQQELVFAYAEGLPALGDSGAVGLLGGDLVDLARHLTILDLWLELEGARG